MHAGMLHTNPPNTYIHMQARTYTHAQFYTHLTRCCYFSFSHCFQTATPLALLMPQLLRLWALCKFHFQRTIMTIENHVGRPFPCQIDYLWQTEPTSNSQHASWLNISGWHWREGKLWRPWKLINFTPANTGGENKKNWPKKNTQNMELDLKKSNGSMKKM